MKEPKYTISVRLDPEVADDFIDLKISAQPTFERDGKNLGKTTLFQELIKGQISNILRDGGTMLMGYPVELKKPTIGMY